MADRYEHGHENSESIKCWEVYPRKEPSPIDFINLKGDNS
jgi:hypothetical protein